MAERSDDGNRWKQDREQMRREGMKHGPRFKWMEADKFAEMLEHERLLASARRDGELERKPSSYRLKTRRK